MDLPSDNSPGRSRFAAWVSDELRPAQALRTLVAASLGLVLQLVVIISFAALIYSGPLASQVGEAIGMIVLGNAAAVLIVALLSSYAGSVAVGQDAPSAILATTVAAAIGGLAGPQSAEQRLATAVAIVVGASVISGLVFLLLGAFRLGGVARYLPFPVIGGFLAGTGWLLLIGGLAVMSPNPFGPAWLTPALLPRWLPGALLGAALLLVSRRLRHPLALPAVLVGALALFYLGASIGGASLADLAARGWLLGPFPSAGALWRFPLTPDRLARVDWLAVAGQAGSLAPIAVVSVVALLLNASGIELAVRRDLNLNRELLATGAANLLAGLLGGLVSYHSISLSNLNMATSGGRRAPAILIAIGLASTVLFGVQLISYVPRLLLGGVLVFLGLGLLHEWLYGAWRKFSRAEFAVIVAIVAAIAVRGFLEGIAVGLLATIGLFVIRYSQIDVIKHAVSGLSYQSRVTRSHEQQVLLAAHGDQIFILQLQGFIFFGTANRLFQRLRARAAEDGAAPLRFVVLDFAHVSGIDSTALLSFSKIAQLVRDRGAVLLLTGMSAGVRAQIGQGGLDELRVFADLDYGVEWCENELIARFRSGLEQPLSLQEQLAYIVTDPAPLASLMRHLRRREVVTGEYIIGQGDQADFMFFVESGQVTARLEPRDGAPVRLETMRGGRTVGELGFYLNSRRSAAVVADEPSTLYLLSREELNQIEQTDPAAAYIFHRVVAHLLAERTAHLIRAVDALRRS
jgi:SulP family sulfate permease